jgi:hypothetical protein
MGWHRGRRECAVRVRVGTPLEIRVRAQVSGRGFVENERENLRPRGCVVNAENKKDFI